jgi:NADPH:quinone reductase
MPSSLTAPAHLPTRRRVARAVRAGGPEVIEVAVEELPPLKPGEVLVRVASAGLNHAETLIRSGNYVVQLPFPYATGGEGAGTVVASDAETLPVGMRVCWGAVLGSCADYLIAPASLLAAIPDSLTFEDAASLAVAGLTAGGLARVWPLEGRTAVVWAAAGAVGRMLVAILAARRVTVIGIASGARVAAVLNAGAAHVIDRASEDVASALRTLTNGKGVAAVFDPVGAATFATSLQLLGPRGCLISYGELSGPAPAIDMHGLFANSLFVTKYNGMRYVQGMQEFGGLIAAGLEIAKSVPAVISEVAGRFPLDQAADAYRALETNPSGKVLVIP